MRLSARRVKRTRKTRRTASLFHAVVRGHVQGVSFRDFTRRNAQKFQLTGYVRNQCDGTVEVIAEGHKEKLESLLELLKEGSLEAFVRDVEVSWGEPEGRFDAFEVR